MRAWSGGGNQPVQLAGTLDIEGPEGRWLRASCDAFGVPSSPSSYSPGFQPVATSMAGMILHGASWSTAYAAATVPGCGGSAQAYGGAYIVMDSRGLGNDFCVAWPNAEIAVMGAPGAVQVLHGRKLAGVEDAVERKRRQAELETEYADRHCNPATAAERGYVDEVIDPRTRRVLPRPRALRSKRAAAVTGQAHPHPL